MKMTTSYGSGRNILMISQELVSTPTTGPRVSKYKQMEAFPLREHCLYKASKQMFQVQLLKHPETTAAINQGTQPIL